jgi:protein-S-isoprenylcysteine O-methyltransferase Ste14
MISFFFAAYAVACYLSFLATFLFFIGFVGGLPLPRTIDIGPAAPWGEAVLIDLALLASFGVQHSVMARAGFKRMWTRIVAPAIERSTYVLLSVLALALVMWQWRPVPLPVIWAFSGPAAWAVDALFWAGWTVMLTSSFLLDHFELFGLSQALAPALPSGAPQPRFRTPLFYRYVRHPLYAGLLAGFWATPRMTAGHLLFAAGFTAYVLVGVRFEERDLLAQFGARYASYRQRVGMLLPWRRTSA